MLRLSFVTGTEPGKWLERYRSRHPQGLEAWGSEDPLKELLQGLSEIVLLRLPDPRLFAGAELDARFHLVRLYEESPGVAVPKESVYAEVGQPLSQADIADEPCHWEPGSDGVIDVSAVREGLSIVAANVGVVKAPGPLLKTLSKKLVRPLPFVDGEPTPIALVWLKEKDSPEIQDFVAVARGRRASSSRGEVKKKRTAREKTLAKQQRRKNHNPVKKRRR